MLIYIQQKSRRANAFWNQGLILFIIIYIYRSMLTLSWQCQSIQHRGCLFGLAIFGYFQLLFSSRTEFAVRNSHKDFSQQLKMQTVILQHSTKLRMSFFPLKGHSYFANSPELPLDWRHFHIPLSESGILRYPKKINYQVSHYINVDFHLKMLKVCLHIQCRAIWRSRYSFAYIRGICHWEWKS